MLLLLEREVQTLITNLEKLSHLPGISGREDAVREYILKEIAPYCEDVMVDAAGSILAKKKGARPAEKRLMLAAHMDEVGLIITRICEDGLLAFAPVGGIDPRVICGKTVTVGENRIPGAIGIVPVHLSSDKSSVPALDAMYIDIGTASKEESEKYVRPGDYAVFDTSFEPFGDGLLKGKALDDRAGCAIMIELMKRDFPNDVYFAFTTMEEVGTRGAKCAAFTLQPDYAIVLESTTAADIAGVAESSKVCKVGKGAVIGFMDRSTIYDRELYQRTLDIAREKNIACQIKQAVAGGNDSGAIHQSRGGVRTMAISLPCRYLHAPASVIARSDFEAVCELSYELALSILASN